MRENKPHLTKNKKVKHISNSEESIVDGIQAHTGHFSLGIPTQRRKNE
jgi:hypothetical protein